MRARECACVRASKCRCVFLLCPSFVVVCLIPSFLPSFLPFLLLLLLLLLLSLSVSVFVCLSLFPRLSLSLFALSCQLHLVDCVLIYHVFWGSGPCIHIPCVLGLWTISFFYFHISNDSLVISALSPSKILTTFILFYLVLIWCLMIPFLGSG